MKLIISQRVLEAAVKKAALFAPAKTTLPALEQLRFSANGKLEITATDLETAVRVTISEAGGYHGITPGVAMLPADLLQRCLTSTLEKDLCYPTDDSGTAKPKLRDVDKEITAVHDTVTRRFRLEIGGKLIASMSTDEFPDLPVPAFEESAPGFYLEAADLAAIARKCLPFVGTDELRRAQMGVLFEYDGTTLTATATNGHELIHVTRPAIAPAPFAAIIQADTLATAIQVLAGPVYVAFNATHVQLAAEGVEVIGRLIDERFPNWKQLIPISDALRAVTVDRAELRAALPSLSPCLNKNTQRLELRVENDYGNSRLFVTAGVDEMNNAQIWQRADDSTPGNGHLSVLLSARYLEHALAALAGIGITFEFGAQPIDGATNYPPILIRESSLQNEGQGDVTIIIMPHRPERVDVTAGMQGTALAAEVAPAAHEQPAVTIEEEVTA